VSQFLGHHVEVGVRRPKDSGLTFHFVGSFLPKEREAVEAVLYGLANYGNWTHLEVMKNDVYGVSFSTDASLALHPFIVRDIVKELDPFLNRAHRRGP